MKYDDELRIGDLVKVRNTHKTKYSNGIYVVIGMADYVTGYAHTPGILVKAMLVDGIYVDWNGYYGEKFKVYEAKDKNIFELKKPNLELVRKFEG